MLISSTMICQRPKTASHRFLLSASDAVWEPVTTLPPEIATIVTDHIGNPEPDYAGFLQFPDASVLELIEASGHFACFRAVEEPRVEYVSEVPPTAVYQMLRSNLKQVGWDVCTGNGWTSASAHGCFPINGITGDIDQKYDHEINEWGLLTSLNSAETWVSINNADIPEHAPWYPVEVLLDETSYRRLTALRSQKPILSVPPVVGIKPSNSWS